MARGNRNRSQRTRPAHAVPVEAELGNGDDDQANPAGNSPEHSPQNNLETINSVPEVAVPNADDESARDPAEVLTEFLTSSIQPESARILAEGLLNAGVSSKERLLSVFRGEVAEGKKSKDWCEEYSFIAPNKPFIIKELYHFLYKTVCPPESGKTSVYF